MPQLGFFFFFFCVFVICICQRYRQLWHLYCRHGDRDGIGHGLEQYRLCHWHLCYDFLHRRCRYQRCLGSAAGYWP